MTAAATKKMHFGKKDIRYLFFIILSALLYSFTMNSFIQSGNLFPGGFAGVSRLLSLVSEKYLHFPISFSIFYFGLNTAVTLFVFNKIGHKFITYSVLWYTLTSVFTSVISVPVITHEPLLIAVFGGLLNGIAIGIALRNNASSGGTDFLAIYMSMKTNQSSWNTMLIVNGVILMITGCLFGWNAALYSIIFQFVSTQVVNEMHSRFKLSNVQIVTNMPDEVCAAIFGIVRHGVTKFACEGGYTSEKHWLLMTTVNTYQLKEVTDVVKKVDPHAFIEIFAAEKIIGNYYQKPLE